MFAKEASPSCAEVLFNDLPNKCAIILRIKDIPVSPRTVDRRIKDIATTVTEQQTVALKAANVFSVALDQGIDINNPHLEVVARYCSNGEVHEKLCCLKPKYGFTKQKGILNTFTKNFEARKIDIKKIFSVITDGSPAMMGQQHGFLLLLLSKRSGTLLWSCTLLFIQKIFVQRFQILVFMTYCQQ